MGARDNFGPKDADMFYQRSVNEDKKADMYARSLFVALSEGLLLV